MGVEGIDTSGHQGLVNWGGVQGGGIGWAYVKATEGHTFVDPQLKASWHGGVQSLTARGAYHFLMPGDGAGQAAFFAAQVGALGQGEFWVLDIEPERHGKLPSRADVDQFVVEAVARLGTRGLLYGNQGDLAATAAATTARENGIGGLILADYGPDDGNRHGVTVPAGWPVVAHQYTSRGQVPGVDGPVDRDYWLGDLASLQTYVGVPGGDNNNGEVGPLPVEVVIQSFAIPSEAVSHMGCSTGGAWLLTQSGNVYALGGAPYFGAPAENKHGENWAAGGRQARAFQARTDGVNGYVVVDQRNETFAYPV